MCPRDLPGEDLVVVRDVRLGIVRTVLQLDLESHPILLRRERRGVPVDPDECADSLGVGERERRSNRCHLASSRSLRDISPPARKCIRVVTDVAATAPADTEFVGEVAREGASNDRGYTGATMRRYSVTTFGCQMNAHDSERIKGMLESLGLGEAVEPAEADVLVFNTCTIREKPDTKLAAYLGEAAARKRRRPDLVVAVGGCYAEAQRERIFERYPFVDVAFGPGSIPHLGDWIEAGGHAVSRGRFGTHETFAATLPMHLERRHSAWVQVSMGCNSVCSYCIVPAVRGREQSRQPGEIVAEVT